MNGAKSTASLCAYVLLLISCLRFPQAFASPTYESVAELVEALQAAFGALLSGTDSVDDCLANFAQDATTVLYDQTSHQGRVFSGLSDIRDFYGLLVVAFYNTSGLTTGVSSVNEEAGSFVLSWTCPTSGFVYGEDVPRRPNNWPR